MKRKNKSREEITKTENAKTYHGHAKPNKEMMH